MLPAYISVDTGMTDQEVSEGLEELQAGGWIMLDATTDMLLDCRAMEFFPPQGSSQQAGALRVLKARPATYLKHEYAKLAYIYCPDFYEVIIGGIENFRGKEDGCPDLVVDQHPHDTLSTDSKEADDSASRARARQLRDGEELEPSSQTDHSTRARGNGWKENVWLFGQLPMKACVVCDEQTHVRDPDGRPRHTVCEIQLQAVEEGGF